MSTEVAVRRGRIRLRTERLTVMSLACILVPFLSAAEGQRRSLSLEERVLAQKAIEQVYWNHRIWPKENPGRKPALVEVMPDREIRARVEDYLKKSTALETYWQRPITAVQLQAEMNRMAAHTRDPRVLQELFVALGNDPRLIAETLARQTLADRLIRNWYAYDEHFHGELKQKAEAALFTCQSVECMPSMGGEYRETTWKIKAGEAEIAERRPHPDAIGVEAGEWQAAHAIVQKDSSTNGSLPVMKSSGLEETAEEFAVTAVLSQGKDEVRTATVSWRKLSSDEWWRTDSATLSAQNEDNVPQYDLPALSTSGCVIDTWSPTNAGANVPVARELHTAVWTGNLMVVWGGLYGYYNNSNHFSDTGGRYDPATDTWTATSTRRRRPRSWKFRPRQ